MRKHKQHKSVTTNIRNRRWRITLRRKWKRYYVKQHIPSLSLEMCIAVGYHDLFDKQENLFDALRRFLTGIPISGALYFIGTMHKQIMYKTTNKETQLKLANDMLPLMESTARNKYYDLRKYARKHNNTLLICNNISALLLSYYVVIYGNKQVKALSLQSNQQKNLYKALLCCNDIFTNAYINAKKCKSILQEFGIAGLGTKIDLPISEFKRDKQIVEPIFKAFALFKYCEKDSFWKARVNKLCAKRKVKTWQDYLTIIISLIKNYVSDSATGIISVPRTSVISDFMEQFSSENTSIPPNPEQDPLREAIMYLRERFLWKQRDGEYIPLNHNLLIDIIYQSVKFDLLTIVQGEYKDIIEQLKRNGHALPELDTKNEKDRTKYIKSQGVSMTDDEEKTIKYSYFGGLNGAFGQNFSQQELLEPVMKLAFGSNSVHLTDSQMGNYVTAPSDYYVRVDDVLYLFELKDTYLNDDIKYSKEANAVWNGVEKDGRRIEGVLDKICKDGKTDRKGVPQLMNSITQIINDKKLDTVDPKASSVRHVFPIVVTTDMAFSANGVNGYVIKRYRNDIRKNYPITNSDVYVHLPVIMNIDFLIRYSEMLYNHKISLKNILMKYFGQRAYKGTSLDAFAFDLYKNYYNSDTCIKHLNLSF